MARTPLKQLYEDDQVWRDWMRFLQARFMSNVNLYGQKLVVLDVDLWPTYLAALPKSVHQYHNCHCCRQFLQRYGNLAFVTDNGRLIPAFWHVEDAPGHYQIAVAEMIQQINAASIVGQFYSSEVKWGHAKTGSWFHFVIKPTDDLIFKSLTVSASEVHASSIENYRVLTSALEYYEPRTIGQAVQIVRSGAIDHLKAVHNRITWFSDVLNASQIKNRKVRERMMWNFVINAPVGFCNVRSSVIGSFLDDIQNGANLDLTIKALTRKMAGDVYQRPQAPPSEGNVQVAERLIEKLGLKRSLERRRATMLDVSPIWQENIPAVDSTGVFSGIKTKSRTATKTVMDYSAPRNMTWTKFCRDILPNAVKIELYAPSTGPYCGFITAKHMDVPPIIKWDHPNNRNPVSWYMYVGGRGRNSDGWGLRAFQYHNVKALVYKPSMGISHTLGNGVMFVVDGAHDSVGQAGLGLFPEVVKSELHQVRATIEAYSNDNILESDPNAVNGLMTDFDGFAVTIRVTTSDARFVIKLDRWE